MKIRGHVLEAANCGDYLRVKLRGKAIASADWQPFLMLELSMPIDDRTRAAYHVGREVTVEVTPK